MKFVLLILPSDFCLSDRSFTYVFFHSCPTVPGYVFTRGGYVELSKRLSLPLGSTLDR